VNAADPLLNQGLSKPAIRELSVLQVDYFAARTVSANDVGDWTDSGVSS
jgi:hypothetical protein